VHLAQRDAALTSIRHYLSGRSNQVSKWSARKWVLAARPTGKPKESDFRFETGSVAEPADKELLLRTKFLSLEPFIRARMDEAKSYAPSTPIGEALFGRTISEVVVSNHPEYSVGDIVLAKAGWQTLSLSNGEGLRKLDPKVAPPTAFVGVLGIPGSAAYIGMKVIGQPKPSETVVVAAASGPVGSLVGQLARRAGARAVGIVGGAEKCAFVRDKLGFDEAVDHRAADFEQRLAAACPNGVDIYFENVGGAVWTAVFPLLNQFARVPVCGLVSQFGAPVPAGPDRVPATIRQVLSKSLTIRGFIVDHYSEMFPEFEREIGAGLKDGTIVQREDVVDGFENAPVAFMGMLEGRNFGKLLIRVAD
jgi:NADPH-dependent curcumin reductase